MDSVYAEYVGIILLPCNVLTEQLTQLSKITGIQPSPYGTILHPLRHTRIPVPRSVLRSYHSMIEHIYNFAAIVAASLEVKSNLHANYKLIGSLARIGSLKWKATKLDKGSLSSSSGSTINYELMS